MECKRFVFIESSAGPRRNPRVPCKRLDFLSFGDAVLGWSFAGQRVPE
jgi:hypothetical protein